MINLSPKTREYITGAWEGTLPIITRMAPKTLYKLTQYLPFDLADIAIRCYRNVPRKNHSWLKWGAKSQDAGKVRAK
ncbi:MAG: hypothetical protein KR126chlam3_00571 [Chlamydiae bacterium]|nr:hypothetical protein [Chlamydiota bacterium]